MKPEMKKLIIANLPYLLFVYLFGKLGQAYRLAEGIDLSQKLLHFADGCAAAFESAAPSFNPFDLLIGVAGAAALRLMVYCKGKNAKKYRKGVEYGSARWGGPKDIAPYIDPNFDNNILLTQTERLTMNNRPKDPKTARNKNVLVIGGSGSGKTRFFVKPNLMQCVSKDYPTSFVITDPKGSLIGEVGQLLIRSGYRVKVLNTINFSKSMKYNPFRYLHSEKDVLKLVNTLICNTKGEGEKSAEDFWVKSERLFYTALIGYIWQEAPEEEMNFTTLLEMINASEAREDDPEFQSPVDLMFERLEERDPDHFAVRQYKKFLLSAGKTRSSILISAGARMAPFDIREVRELMEDDELELDTIGDEKTALFLIMSDTDTTFNFILAMVQSQLINLLCDRADDKYGGRLPVHVRMILDEFANIGQIPNFDKLIATIRSREISASIILQSQSQLKAIYKDAAEIISDNCDCTLFLSGRGKNAKEISDVLGKETIDSYNQSENRGAQTSHGLNYQKLGKELMSQDEIATMDGGKCILQVRGVRPFFSEKYDITRHPRYPQHFRHVAAEAVQADNIILHYEKGDREQPAGLYFDGRPDPKLGAFLRYEAKPNEPEHLRELLRQEQKGRAQLAPGDFKAHVTALHDGMILAEAQRIVAGLKDLSAPNSPNKTHFIVELSPYFVQIASSKDTDRLFSMLPYKSLCFTGMKDRHGLYAVIGKDENRDKEVRRPRASIRRQLSETKQAQAPKKAPARTKKNELEV